MARIIETYDYTDEDGALLYENVRYEPKAFRQRRPDGNNGWTWNLNGTRRVLYRLPDLLEAPIQDWVCVTEGEKDAISLRVLGFGATTSGNASSWRSEFAEFFKGRLVAVFADNDKAGERYAKTVVETLQDVAAEVRIVEPDGLQKGGDITDWLAEHDSLEPEALKEHIHAMIDEALPVATAETDMVSFAGCHADQLRRIEQPVPFPVASLPQPLARFVDGAACAIGCDPSYVVLPLMAGLAAAIGNTRRIALKNSWVEPAIVWAAIVGDSGTLKSPAIEVGLRPIRRRQQEALQQWTKSMADHRVELAQYEKDLRNWKGARNDNSDPPVKPDEPVAERFWCDDATIEALAVLLRQNPRGLLVVRDELAGWLGSFDRYGQGRGSDAAKWLELFGGRSIMVDRKSASSEPLYIHRATVSLAGGIQPGTLQRALGAEHRENGLAARLLLACPPRRPKRWTEHDISATMEDELERVFERLYSLQPLQGEDGDARPLDLPLTPEGKRVWVSFYNSHAQEQVELTGDLAASWSKLEGYAARLALVVHLARWAAGDPTLENPNLVDEGSVNAGVELSRWFGHEARRVYAILGESPEERQHRRLVEMIQSKGGAVTVRDVQRSSRQYATAADAEQALNRLVRAGMGVWESPKPSRAGGRPVRRFMLKEYVDTDNTCTH